MDTVDRLSPAQRAHVAREICALVAARALRAAHAHVRRTVQDGMRDEREAVSHAGHDGKPARAIDIDQHDLVAAELRRELTLRIGPVDLRIDSEEAQRSFTRTPGTWIGVVDPLDGTSVLERRGDGYAVALMLLTIGNDGAAHAMGAAIADARGTLTSWCHLPTGGGEIAVETVLLDPDAPADRLTHGIRWLTPSRRDPRAPLAVAVVAADPERRRLLRRRTTLLEDPELVLELGGGNPALHWLLSLGTAAVVELKPVRLRDAIFLAALELCGFCVSDDAGALLSPVDELERLALAPGQRLTPYIAAVDDVAHARVLRCIRDSDAGNGDAEVESVDLDRVRGVGGVAVRRRTVVVDRRR
jgi:hypothetical protein